MVGTAVSIVYGHTSVVTLLVLLACQADKSFLYLHIMTLPLCVLCQYACMVCVCVVT